MPRRRAAADPAAAVPVPIAPWREVEGRVVLVRPRPTRRGLAGLAERFSAWASVPRVRLDETGSDVWRRLDGRRTVAEIARGLAAADGSGMEAAEERVGRFVGELAHLGFVELRVPME
ncbi:MAG TPA: PqqD family protein [Thermoanaerobaculia bacterium]|nr:PqqD family protein [Thermoanaerobaculia bacterium]